MSDDDFAPLKKNAIKDLDRARIKLAEFTKFLDDHGLMYNIFITPEKASFGKKGAIQAAMGGLRLNGMGAIAHVLSLMQNKDYLKAALLAFLMIKKGKVKLEAIQQFSSEERGFFHKLKRKLGGGDDE